MPRFWIDIIFICLGTAGLQSCRCSGTSSTPDLDGAVESISRVITDAPEGDQAVMMRLTPEQYSNFVSQKLGVTLWENSDVDPIVEYFGVALGGVDFQSTFERDPSAKVQTQLVVRSLAWTIALLLVFNEFERIQAGEVAQIFTQCSLTEDWPSADAAANARWESQLREFYWRFFARPPTDEEMALNKEAFIAIARDNGEGEWAPMGWMGVLYALMSTEEFWYL